MLAGTQDVRTVQELQGHMDVTMMISTHDLSRGGLE